MGLQADPGNYVAGLKVPYIAAPHQDALGNLRKRSIAERTIYTANFLFFSPLRLLQSDLVLLPTESISEQIRVTT